MILLCFIWNDQNGKAKHSINIEVGMTTEIQCHQNIVKYGLFENTQIKKKHPFWIISMDQVIFELWVFKG